MSEWWTYRLSDFLMFAPRTYWRLFELYNVEVWPGQWLALAFGLALLAAAARRSTALTGWAQAGLAVTWIWVAWAFHLQRYASINWAATWFALAFAIEGGLLLAAGLLGGVGRGGGSSSSEGRGAARGWPGRLGIGLLAFALLLYPALGLLIGRPWAQAEFFGVAPDPTAVGTLGWLLWLSARRPSQVSSTRWLLRALWPLPLAWCAISGATLWTMGSPLALLPPGAALLALWGAWRAGVAGHPRAGLFN